MKISTLLTVNKTEYVSPNNFFNNFCKFLKLKSDILNQNLTINIIRHF